VAVIALPDEPCQAEERGVEDGLYKTSGTNPIMDHHSRKSSCHRWGLKVGLRGVLWLDGRDIRDVERRTET